MFSKNFLLFLNHATATANPTTENREGMKAIQKWETFCAFTERAEHVVCQFTLNNLLLFNRIFIHFDKQQLVSEKEKLKIHAKVKITQPRRWFGCSSLVS